MPSRLLLQQQLPPPAPPPPPLPAAVNNNHHPRRGALVASAAASAAAVCVLLLLIAAFFLLRRRYWRLRPTLPFSPPPAPSRPLRRYSRRALRRATAGFHPSRLLGRGAASPVYLATFPGDTSLAAVKTRASPHELHLLASLPESPRVVSLLGYSSSSSGHEENSLSLVFEYMPHGSLQAALFGVDGDRFLDWPRRLGVIRDVARGLAFLHGECAPPVVHGDLKPSNVLLDADFRAKLADFGLARFKTPDVLPVPGGADEFMSQELGGLDHLSTTTAASVANGGGGGAKDESSGPASAWGKEWWWKQDGSGELDSKDYVAEWIGTQINCPERNADWADDMNNKNSPSAATDEHATGVSASPEQDKKSADGKVSNGNDMANRKEATQMREWWKEEFFEEMSKKGGNSYDKRHRSGNSNKSPWLRSISLKNNAEQPSGVDLSSFRRSRKRSRRQRGRSVGAGSDTMNNNADFLSRELSSTTSMRGTVCYVAPECGGDHDIDQLEKADIYSFGVLVLVILSGRRPLHILSSPMKLERANLVSWCRQLAKAGSVLEVVDERMVESEGYDREQAAMCVHLALHCLQRQPELRPDSADIVKMLDGEMEVPHPPPAVVENSPSPRIRPFPRSSRRAAAQHIDNATAAE